MERNFKKLWPFAVATLVAFTSALQANTDNAQMRNLENRVNALEQRRGANGMVNPSARSQVQCGADLFVTADLLVWQARENGLALGIMSKSGPEDFFIRDGKVKNLSFQWNAGFRLGLGYNLPHDGWDLSLTWLRFTNHAHRKSHAHDNQVFYPRNQHAGDLVANDNVCTTAKGRWHMQLNQLDLDLGREFFVSKWLTLRPHFGMRTDWIRQRMKSKYDDFFEPSTAGDDVSVKMKDRWWGIGLEAGLDTQWGLGGGWSIYGNAAAAIIYGFHHDSFKDKDMPPTTTFAEFVSSAHTSHPILDLQLGLRWDHMFCNDRFHIGIQSGWEHHIYFSQNQFMYSQDYLNWGQFLSNQGDLTMQGWTLSARFDF